MNNHAQIRDDYSEFVEVDPTGRYGRYKEILGKGASKIVYRAFDEYQGIEVAWNQVKLYDFLQSPEDLERLYSEIHLLKTLKHNNIMKFYTSWVDTSKKTINFVTEMFTSGTLKQYRKRHKKVNIMAIKSWCRQILKGLLYLHSLDPPVIHRDLKCDNIFVNGNQGQVKIGDLGLAAILQKSHVAHCVGTPEFMAPEVYAEEYNELVDIYSFGMCILEMVTFEYPYSECTYSAQIYKKVISGKKPDALNKVTDPEVRQFIDKCLADVSLRLSARELLDDPFLKFDSEFDLRSMGSWREGENCLSFLREPYIEFDNEENLHGFGSFNEHSNGVTVRSNGGESEYDSVKIENSGIQLFECNNDECELGITMKGKKRKDGSIFLRLRISDDEGRIRNIYFPFDVENDTALSVATEMVAELDLADQDVIKIADMIDDEIISLVPEWKPGPGFMETPRFSKSGCCENCVSKSSSTVSFLNFLSNTSVSKDLKFLDCSQNGCAAIHGRFEEISYQIDSPRKNLIFLNKLSEKMEICDRQETLECSMQGSGESYMDEEIEKVDQIISTKAKIKENEIEKNKSFLRRSISKAVSCFSNDSTEEYEKEMELRNLINQQLNLVENSPINRDLNLINGVSPFTVSNPFQGEIISKSPLNGRKRPPKLPKLPKSGPIFGSFAKGVSTNTKGFYIGSLVSNSLHRSTSLPIDALDL